MELILGVRLDLTSQMWGFFPKTPKVFPKIPEVFFPKIPKAFPKIMIFFPKIPKVFFPKILIFFSLKFWFFFPKFRRVFFPTFWLFPPNIPKVFPWKFQRLFFPMMNFHINFIDFGHFYPGKKCGKNSLYWKNSWNFTAGIFWGILVTFVLAEMQEKKAPKSLIFSEKLMHFYINFRGFYHLLLGKNVGRKKIKITVKDKIKIKK